MAEIKDTFTLILILTSIVLPAVAFINLKYTIKKYHKVSPSSKLSGCEVARKILDNSDNGIVHIIEYKAFFSDYYDFKRKTIKLSEKVFNNESSSALAIASHEVAHANLVNEKNTLTKIRCFLLPYFFTDCRYILLAIMAIPFIKSSYALISGLFVVLIFIIQIIIKQVEIDTSFRAINDLKAINLVNATDVTNATKVLKSGLLTYSFSIYSSLLIALAMFINI